MSHVSSTTIIDVDTPVVFLSFEHNTAYGLVKTNTCRVVSYPDQNDVHITCCKSSLPARDDGAVAECKVRRDRATDQGSCHKQSRSEDVHMVPSSKNPRIRDGIRDTIGKLVLRRSPAMRADTRQSTWSGSTKKMVNINICEPHYCERDRGSTNSNLIRVVYLEGGLVFQSQHHEICQPVFGKVVA